MTDIQTWSVIAVITLVTALTRFLPFAVFGRGRKTPPLVEKLGRLLPYSIMGMLVVYCLKGTSFSSLGGFVPALISIFVVTGVYLWRKNTLLSIVAGTVSYMILVQIVF